MTSKLTFSMAIVSLQPQEKSKFQRNVLWKFEDTKMLIGSNMPIFGGGKYPAVSLRLK